MGAYKKRNRSDEAVNPDKKLAALDETELVLKLKKNELFDQHAILPHAELNSVVFKSVDAFVDKYRGTEMTLTLFTDPVSPQIQNVFREVYRSHYEDELKKVTRYLKRRFYRGFVLLLFSVCSFFLCRWLLKMSPEETILSYILGNVSCFCLWEIGYTQFASRDAVDQKKRILRALNANIQFL